MKKVLEIISVTTLIMFVSLSTFAREKFALEEKCDPYAEGCVPDNGEIVNGCYWNIQNAHRVTDGTCDPTNIDSDGVSPEEAYIVDCTPCGKKYCIAKWCKKNGGLENSQFRHQRSYK